MQAASPPQRRFEAWEERHVSEDRGSRVVHYYLKDRQGHETLAVIGTERSRRHMVYVVCDEFLALTGLDRKTTPSFKWRARREVIDWLTSLSSTSSSPELRSAGSPDSSMGGANMDEPEEDVEQAQTRSPQPSNVLWKGKSWTCRKLFKHYSSFQRNGITISVKDFVFVMAEKEHHLAYVEDMYEDKKSRKKLRVRWFHKRNELSCKIPAPPPHPREVFFTHFPQVLSVECVDGLATILAPEHFDKCPAVLPSEALSLIHVCFRQLDNDGISPLNICEVDGYWRQKTLVVIGAVEVSPKQLSPKDETGSEDMEDEETETGSLKKRRRSTRYTRRRVADGGHSDSAQEHSTDAGSAGNTEPELLDDEFDVGDKVELMASELRGCWFTGSVIDRGYEIDNGKVRRFRLIRYDDLRDDDGKANFEEWRELYRKFAPRDKLGVHAATRPTIRPHPGATPRPFVCEFGSAVDAWFDDGWWEGVTLARDGSEVVVYLPDEGWTERFSISDLRPSRDWLDGRWVDVKVSPEVLAGLFGEAKVEKQVGRIAIEGQEEEKDDNETSLVPSFKRQRCEEMMCAESMQPDASNVDQSMELDNVDPAARCGKRQSSLFVPSLVMSR